MKRSWDNDTPVTRGPATMKAGEMKFLWTCSLQAPVDIKISIVE